MPDLADTASRLESILVERLIAWATSNWPSEQAYAFGLVFTIGHSPLPAPGIGTVEEQEAWLDDPDDYGVGLMIWNPAEYEAYDPDFTEDGLPPEAAELAEQLNDAWMDDEDAEDEIWVQFMGRVAARLAAHDWGDLPRTEDFVVFATDAEVEEQAQLEAQLAHSVSADVLDRLRGRGLLHVTPMEDL